MPRTVVAVLLALLLAGASLAADLKGKLKSVDPQQNTVTVTVGGKDRTFTVGPEVKVSTGAGKDIKDRLKAKGFKPGATVTVTTAKKDGKEVVTALLLGERPPESFTDPVKAGPDFLIQGEYDGHRGGVTRWGAQVVAEGNGRFTVWFLNGGLPGAGWDGKTRIKAEAVTEGGKTHLTTIGWGGTIADGVINGSTVDGFVLKKVERRSPTLGAKPPQGAIVLFDGTNTDAWNAGQLVEGHLLSPGVTSKRTFRDFKLHVEFRLPFRPQARGQSRGNSGVYLQQRYEIQVLDSFGLAGTKNECGAIYEQVPPAFNLCFPPLAWQTYDIELTAARFDAAGKKVADAVISVWHNGVLVHDKVAVKGPTGHGRPEQDTPGPIHFQNHGNPVHFRNVWLVPGPMP